MTWWPLAWFAGTIIALGIIWKSPVGTLVRWLFRRNVAQPLKAASRALISDTVTPMVDDIKANAKAQHDEQNTKLAAIDSRLTDHGRRLSLIEDHITRPRGGH